MRVAVDYALDFTFDDLRYFFFSVSLIRSFDLLYMCSVVLYFGVSFLLFYVYIVYVFWSELYRVEEGMRAQRRLRPGIRFDMMLT